jgi:hypothetical protein
MYEFLGKRNFIKEIIKDGLNTDKRFIQMWLVLCLGFCEQVIVKG